MKTFPHSMKTLKCIILAIVITCIVMLVFPVLKRASHNLGTRHSLGTSHKSYSVGARHKLGTSYNSHSLGANHKLGTRHISVPTETSPNIPPVANTRQATKKPNIIFVLTDDQGFHDIGYHGSEIMTPTLDAVNIL